MPSSAPCLRAKASFSSDDAQAITRAPIDLAELDRRKPDAAGRAEHRQRLAGFQPGAILQRVKGGAVGDAEAGGAIEIEAARES